MTPFEATTDLKIILATEIAAGWMAGVNSDLEERECPYLDVVSAYVSNSPPEPERDAFLQHILSCSKCRVHYAQIGLMETWHANSVTWSLRHVRRFYQSDLPSAMAIASKMRTFLGVLKVNSAVSTWESIPLNADASLRPVAPLELDEKGRLVIQAEVILRSPLEISFSLEANWAALDLCSTIVSERSLYAIVDLSCCPGPAMTLDWDSVKIQTRELSFEQMNPKSGLVPDAMFLPIDLEEVDQCSRHRPFREKSTGQVMLSDSAHQAAVLARYINAYSAGNQGWIPEDAYDLYVEFCLDSFGDSDDPEDHLLSSDENIR